MEARVTPPCSSSCDACCHRAVNSRSIASTLIADACAPGRCSFEVLMLPRKTECNLSSPMWKLSQFQISNFRSQISDLRFQISASRSQIPDLSFQIISDLEFQISRFRWNVNLRSEII